MDLISENVLIELGLSKNEAKIYLALLSFGFTTVTQIAEMTKLHRANVYEATKKLVYKGLVSHVDKGGTIHYEALEPSVLFNILKEKENKLEMIMPQLQLSKKMAETKGEAAVFEGLNALFNIMYDFLKHNDDICVFGIPASVPEIVRNKITLFHKERINKKIVMKHIYNHAALERISFLNKMDFTEAKYLPPLFDSEVSTWVCGDEIMLTLWTKPMTCIRIQNRALANSYKNYFSLLWKQAKR